MATINGIQYIRADVNDNSEIVVRVKQYDKATRILNVTYAESGNVYRIDSNLYRAVAKVKTPSYHNADYLATIESDGTITIPLSDNILNTAGIGSVEIDLYSKTSESVISTMPIKLIVIGSVYDDTEEVGSDEYSALKDLISEVTVKETEYETAENVRVDAENKRIAEEKIRKEEEGKRAKAESERAAKFGELKKQSEEATAGAEKVNIKSNSSTDSYTLTITNRKGQSSTSPNLLNKLSIGTVSTLDSKASATASLSGNFGSQKLNIGIPGGLIALQPVRNWSDSYITIGMTTNCTVSDFNRTPIVGDVFINLDKGSNAGTWEIMSVSGSSVTMKLLSFTNLHGVDGKHGYGLYRYNGALDTSVPTCTRSLIQPTSGELYSSETIIDTNGNIFAITKNYESGDSVSIAFRYSLFERMTVDDFEEMFTPTVIPTQNSENDDVESTTENVINGNEDLKSTESENTTE